jgi:circadian clock protein KaiB
VKARATGPIVDREETFWHLRLYVSGNSPKSLRALANLTALCEGHLGGSYEIEVVDLSVQPLRARADDILAIPTLVRRLPAPVRKFIGDLANTEGLLVELHVGTPASRRAVRESVPSSTR